MKTCYIVGAGDFSQSFTPNKDDLVIAADGGYDHLFGKGIRCDLVVGDLDSIKALPSSVETVRHKVEKDETDMFLAYKEGVDLGFCDFVMLGATGGRLDHTYANLSLLLYAKERGHNVTVMDKNGIILCLKDESISLAGNHGATFSVFAVGGDASGVSIKNAKYEVDGVVLTPAFPLGVSNEFTDESAKISVENGALLVIAE